MYRFHVYAVTFELDSYERLPLNTENNQANIVVKKKVYGGVPATIGSRNDCVVIFEEMEEAKTILKSLTEVICQMQDPKTIGVLFIYFLLVKIIVIIWLYEFIFNFKWCVMYSFSFKFIHNNDIIIFIIKTKVKL